MGVLGDKVSVLWPMPRGPAVRQGDAWAWANRLAKHSAVVLAQGRTSRWLS